MDFEKIIPIELMQRNIVASVGGVQARVVAATRPKWDDMIKNYPNTSVDTVKLYNDIGNGLIDLYKKAPEDWENTCSFRMSRGLNLSGFKLPKDNSKYREKGSSGGVHVGTSTGVTKNYYWYRVKELGKYLEDHLGAPEFDVTLKRANLGEIKVGLSTTDWSKLSKLKGIVMFKVSGWGNASGHFTLWDGKNLIYPGDPRHDDPSSELYYFNMKYEAYHPIKKKNIVIQTDEIKLWELK
ncbi:MULTISPECIES: T6SS effector amidase Tae4 family protein [Flavobacterium]|uniref:Type VI secretion system amidase effector protein Tae4 n=1 Tax=Flavobacterium lipolyticum TaxID=2893754 RepID=A0ABS8M707_9FLAO|nr:MULTISPECIES: T6SS effector amidase Tae4 family protein [Flavobacterium]MCC9020617.1 type VI secretion system amidase effector protein Tae4 [Flavobacterium sp. F-126]